MQFYIYIKCIKSKQILQLLVSFLNEVHHAILAFFGHSELVVMAN